MAVRLTAVGTLLAALLVPASPAAAKAFCLGRKATKVGTSAGETITGTKKADVIVAGAGDDTVLGASGDDRICGGLGNDVLFGQGGTDLLSGQDDSDQLSGGKGDDRLDGGLGEGLFKGDYANYFPSTTAVNVNLTTGKATGEGNDTLKGIESVFGSSFADTIRGNDATNALQPLGGNDDVNAGGGLDIVFDGAGGDTPTTDGNDLLSGGEGPDAIHYGNSPAAVAVDLAAGTATGNGSDTINAFEGAFGSSFNDTLKGDTARNLLLGGLGNDEIDGRGGNDAAAFWFSANGVNADLATSSATGEGTDHLVNIEGLLGSVFGNDTLRGNEANNLLDGDGADDHLFGAGGDDWLTGGPGNDEIDAGTGTNDIADYSTKGFGEINAAVTVDLANGNASGGLGNDVLSGVEAVYGSDSNDTLAGDDLPNTFFGGAGDDEIGSGDGDDRIDGGDGNDEVDAGEGFDKCRNVEVVFGCDEVNSNDVPDHPLLGDAQDVALYRRNL